MKNFKIKRLFSLALIGGLSTLSASTVFAAAGDDITNTATLTYDVGGTPTNIDSNTTSFKEDRLINFTVVKSDTTTISVSPGATAQVQTFTVTNTGNGAQDFSLTALDQATTSADPFLGANDSFDVTPAVYVDNGDGIFVAIDDTAVFIEELAATASATVYIVSTIPGGLADGEVAVTSLVAQVAVADGVVDGVIGVDIITDDSGAGDTAAEETVFNDAAGTDDNVKDGKHSDRHSYTVSTGTLTVTKAASALWDPVNGNSNPKAIPGAYMQYTITVTNAGSGSAELTSLADTLVTTLLDPDLIDATNTPESAAGNGIKVAVTGSTRNATTIYCTGDTSGDIDTDGCSYPGDAPVINSVVGVNLGTVLLAEDIAPVGVGPEDYAAGELKAGESVAITFNAIVQ